MDHCAQCEQEGGWIWARRVTEYRGEGGDYPPQGICANLMNLLLRWYSSTFKNFNMLGTSMIHQVGK